MYLDAMQKDSVSSWAAYYSCIKTIDSWFKFLADCRCQFLPDLSRIGQSSKFGLS